jgi:glutamate-1-semialdehyde 2,1-aminomutase
MKSTSAPSLPNVTRGQALYQHARERIPGATQLFGKRAELYLPEHWPAYYSKAKGCRIWDIDGNEYLDFTMCGIGTSVLGYADPDVETAVIAAIRAGNMATLNCPEEVELADLLCEFHPWASRVRFARTGGEIMAMAVRIARAATSREKIAFCGYHGWHDWYLAVNLSGGDRLAGHLLPGLEPKGVPQGLAGTVMPFAYNDLGALQNIVGAHGHELAAIVMEPVRSDGPAPGFLAGVRELASRCGAVLIFDEITSGWRMRTCGMHMIYGVEPDMAAFAKTMSNGIPMAAVIGRVDVMDYAQRTFISSAYWTEKSGPAAALATLKKHRAIDAGRRLTETGRMVQTGWRRAADETGLPIKIQGIPPITNFVIQHPNALALQTYFIQEMLARGYLASDRFYPTCAHGEIEVQSYLEALGEVFGFMADAIKRDNVMSRLKGPVKQSGFGRLN